MVENQSLPPNTASDSKDVIKTSHHATARATGCSSQ